MANKEETDSAENQRPGPTIRHWQAYGIRAAYFQQAATWPLAPEEVVLCFCLEGALSLAHTSQEKELLLAGQQHSLFYTGGSEASLKAEGAPVAALGVAFTQAHFLKMLREGAGALQPFAAQVAAGVSGSAAAEGLSMSLEIMAAVSAIRSEAGREGGLGALFLAAKCAELLVLQADSLVRQRSAPMLSCRTEYDRERLHFARDYLLQHIELPPSLPQLARIAGLNEHKLKNGFRELFGNTVFGYLANYRLERAREALTQTRQPVGEIAFRLGFSSSQHLSAAFRQKYGLTPRQARKLKT